MNKYISLFIILLIACGEKPRNDSESQTLDTSKHWDQMQAILDNISAPKFNDYTLDISIYGAVPDGKSNSLPAIQKAIEQCSADGGGRVLVPPGAYYLAGPIHLYDNVNLHIEEGATLYFSTDPKDYLPVVKTRWEGVECYNYSPLVYAYQQSNIAITGKGVLDGQASTENWWSWVDKKALGWKPGMPSQADSMSRPRLFDWNTREVPVEERILGAGALLRPNFVQPYECKNILIEGVTIKNSPMWILHPVLSENITIQNVRVISHGPNSDGCDPESCKNVLIKNCYFDTGDDCIALKSGRNQDGRRIARPIENVVVQDCEMKDGHGGVVIGSEVSGGARNIYAENCIMDSPNLDRAIRVKTNKVRGGKIENLFFRNITVGEVKEAVVRINMRYPIYSDPNQEYIPVVDNIFVENVTSKKSKYGVLIDGYSEDHPVRGLHVFDCKFEGVQDGNKIEYATNLAFENYYLNGQEITLY